MLPSGKQIEDVLQELRCHWFVDEKGDPRAFRGKSEADEEDEGGEDDDSKASAPTTSLPPIRIPLWLCTQIRVSNAFVSIPVPLNLMASSTPRPSRMPLAIGPPKSGLPYAPSEFLPFWYVLLILLASTQQIGWPTLSRVSISQLRKLHKLKLLGAGQCNEKHFSSAK
jgi:hypothetical protein